MIRSHTARRDDRHMAGVLATVQDKRASCDDIARELPLSIPDRRSLAAKSHRPPWPHHPLRLSREETMVCC